MVIYTNKKLESNIFTEIYGKLKVLSVTVKISTNEHIKISDIYRSHKFLTI